MNAITINDLTFTDQAERTNRVFAGWFNDSWTEEVDGEECEMYWDEFSALATDKDGNEYRVTWLFKNYKDGRLEDDNLDWDNPESIEVL
ncbi:hypothetical protein [Alkanindiges illinoisensis]|uniref:Uncharacterized protein n=1 Tax=Alkanindiges illinoisensis TaxID=197183 RepID=A0A4Y7X982_9GAMM|nr:hypothetical protein [Alkanindiges illinoisensis]TEU23356.1 hypothetical protein E2B99_13655 [Alkanindiges illinoisensis]